MKKVDIKKVVREKYGSIASRGNCSCSQGISCCGDSSPDMSLMVGYSKDDLKSIPDGSNLGLGCGNPVALASLKKGEVVLDLGSGAGIDCFLAARNVGPSGRVIGIDMTHEMLEKAKANAKKSGYKNVEFRLGEIEHLPVADNHVDVIISNCVINLSIDKRQVFREAYRVLKPHGRLMVSDLVLLKELPDWARRSMNLYVGCVAGALLKKDYIQAIKDAGFSIVKILHETVYPIDISVEDPAINEVAPKSKITKQQLTQLAQSVVSINISAMKLKR